MSESVSQATAQSVARSLGHGRAKALIEHTASKAGWLAEIRSWDAIVSVKVIRTVLLSLAAAYVFYVFVSQSNDDRACGLWCNAGQTLKFFLGQLQPKDMSDMPPHVRPLAFLVPVLGILAFAFTFLPVVKRFILRIWIVLPGEHVVMAATSNVDVAIATAYRHLGRQVIVVAPMLSANVLRLEKAGACYVQGSPTDPKVLRKAGINRAFAVFSLAGRDRDALPLCHAAAAALQPAHHRRVRKLLLFIRIRHRSVRGFLEDQARVLVGLQNVELRLYDRERGVARSVLNRYPVDWGSAPGTFDVHAVIIGFGEMGQAMFQQLVHVGLPSTGQRCCLTVIDRNAAQLEQEMITRHPALAQIANVRFLVADLTVNALTPADMQLWFSEPFPATSVYVCCDDDLDSLTLALGLRCALAAAGMMAPPFFLHQPEETAPIHAVSSLQGQIDTLRMVPFGDIVDDADPTFLLREEVDLLARQIHEQYLSNLDPAEVDKTRPSHKPWESLPESFRNSNRAQADFRPLLLRALDVHPVVNGGDPSFSITNGKLEQLAALEHVRWCRERWLAGWRFGQTTDVANRVSKDLVGYGELDEPAKTKDRNAVRTFPVLLKNASIGIKRDHRVGIWFESHAEAASALADKLLARLFAATAETTNAHLQLVLPLRHRLEMEVAARLIEGADAGIDVAIPRQRDGAIVANCAHPEIAYVMTACADRAFNLLPHYIEGRAELTACVIALSSVCDMVLVVSETSATVGALLNQVSAAGCRNLEVVTLGA